MLEGWCERVRWRESIGEDRSRDGTSWGEGMGGGGEAGGVWEGRWSGGILVVVRRRRSSSSTFDVVGRRPGPSLSDVGGRSKSSREDPRDGTTSAALDSDRHGRGFSHGFLEPKIAAFRTGLLHEAILRRYAFSEDG